MSFRQLLIVPTLLVGGVVIAAGAARAQPLPGTELLTQPGDIADRLVDGADRFLLRQIDRTIDRRARFWHRDRSSPERYQASLEPNRKRLAHILGLGDPRVAFDAPQLLATTKQRPRVGRSDRFDAFAVRWPAVGDVHGEGLLLVPTGQRIAEVIAIPDADQTPEMIAGLAEGLPPLRQFARRLAESGCRVLIPSLIDRSVHERGRARLTQREFLYRPAYELGRHLIGYELQKVLAGVDWLQKEAAGQDPKIGLVGWGEGGMLALYAAALDPRIDATCVSGYFEARRQVWQEPIDRNVFGLLEQFGDAELAAMVAPRALVVEAAEGPACQVLPGTGGGPGRLRTPPVESVRGEVQRARKLVGDLQPAARITLIESDHGTGPYGSAAALQALLEALVPAAQLADLGAAPERLRDPLPPAERQRRQVHELDRHNQWLLGQSAAVRRKFFQKLDRSSLEKFQQGIEWYRTFFYDQIIGRFDQPLLPPNARSRKAYDQPKWTGYEVLLDVFPDVVAYGILLLPKDIKPGVRRPVVVCQHGLEGRPQDVVSGDHPAYHDFAAKLAERGFITFAPQNLYLFGDRFRTLQRKANPIKKTLYSIIVPQHQQICAWLASLPQVDPQRIAFYGLSYGGKTAMRVPPLVPNYCLSICSADFNEWIWKNASTHAPYSYVWTGEYEMFDFDLGSTFNYAEMAALIAPRPFMVERGHFDGVSEDEMVALEFAKVRHLYQAELGIGDRCQIEWFVGPHTIHGQGTFAFLHRHLDWPQP